MVAQQVTSPEEVRERLRTLLTADAEAYFFVSDGSTAVHARLALTVSSMKSPAEPLPIRTRGRSREATYAAAPNARSSGRQPSFWLARASMGAFAKWNIAAVAARIRSGLRDRSTRHPAARSERVVSWPSARLLDSHVAKVEAMEER